MAAEVRRLRIERGGERSENAVMQAEVWLVIGRGVPTLAVRDAVGDSSIEGRSVRQELGAWQIRWLYRKATRISQGR